jgi:hypothetical protein
MNRFSPLLTEIYQKLDLPQPTKSEILLEIAADMEDLYETCIQEGLGEKDALARTAEKFQLDDTVIQDLVRVHQSAFKKWFDKLTARTQTRWERGVLVLTVLSIIILAGYAMIASEFFRTASRFVYPLSAIGLSILVIFLAKIYALYIKKDHNVRNLRKGLSLLLFLGVLNIFIGLWGYLIELYTIGSNSLLPGSSFITIICTVNPSAQQIRQITECLMKSSSVMLLCLFLMVVTVVFWYMLMTKIIKIEQAEADVLVDTSP